MPIAFSLRDLIYYIGLVVIGVFAVFVLMALFVALISSIPMGCARGSNLDGEVNIYNLSDRAAPSTYNTSDDAANHLLSVYSFYVQDDNGGYHLYDIPASSTTIYCQGDNYRLVYHAEGASESLANESNVCSILDYLTTKKKQGDFRCYYKLYVPEGFI